MHCLTKILKKFRQGNATTEETEMAASMNRNLSAAFVEHTLDRNQLAQLFPQSGINVNNPTKSTGLSTAEAKRLLEQNGRNALTPPKEISNVMLLLHQFLNMFWIMLIGAGTASLAIYFIDMTVLANLVVALVLYIVIIGMCLLSFWEEKSARNVVRGFQKLLPTSCEVVRDGRKSTVPAEELVLGDLVFIRNGNKVAADVRILTCNGIRLEMSSITGEPEPIEFNAEPVASTVNIFESNNVALNGSACVDGEGLGVVIRTADNTILGQIAKLTTAQKDRKSLLDKEINKFVLFLTILALTMAAIVFVAGIIISHFKNIFVIFINGFVCVIIANYPCGLPATLTSQMTIVARRMARKSVLCKKLQIIETFGAATIIASDKTGTLTKNDMTVTEVWYDKRTESIDKSQIDTVVQKKSMTAEVMKKDATTLQQMLTVMTVCNRASKVEPAMPMSNKRKMSVFTPPTFEDIHRKVSQIVSINVDPTPTEDKQKFTGSPSEIAMLRYAADLVNIDKLRADHEVVFEILFNSKRKWNLMITKKIDKANMMKKMSSAVDDEVELLLMMKGAAEILIEMCTTLATEQGEIPLDDQQKKAFLDAYSHFGDEGRRVIGFATKSFKAPGNTQFTMEEGNYPKAGLCFLGMVAIMDPPRETTAGAVADCRSAGIKVFMVTGDHPSTAAAIAREIGLIENTKGPKNSTGGADYAIIRGEQLPALSKCEWDDLLKKRNIVFARTTPEQKLLIVEQCQQRGEIVAVTGDGVNDAPALKKADIGVAMGICGSEVAKQAADICLMDDNFASIVHSIKEGRTMYDNLKKTFGYTLPHLIPEVLPIILNLILGMPLGLTALQIIVIDLGSELPPTIAFAYQPSEKDIMQRKPRKLDRRLVGFGILLYAYGFAGITMTTLCALSYLFVYWYHGIAIGDLLYTTTSGYWTAESKDFHSMEKVFTAQQQLTIMAQSCAAYHLTLVISQVGHFFMCTTLRTSIVQQVPSKIAIGAIVLETLMVCLFVYTPGIQHVMGTAAPPGYAWLFPLTFIIIMLIFNETRKFLIRTYPMSKIVRVLKW